MTDGICLQADELHNQQSQIVLRSRRADVDWAALRNVQVPTLVGLFTFHALLLVRGQDQSILQASVRTAMLSMHPKCQSGWLPAGRCGGNAKLMQGVAYFGICRYGAAALARSESQ